MTRTPTAVSGLFMAACLAVLSTDGSAQMREADPEASKALGSIIEAYRMPPGVSVNTELKVGAREGDMEVFEPPLQARWIITPGRKIRGEFGGYTLRTGEGKLQAIHESRSGLYFGDEDGGSPYYAILQRFVDLPWPTLALGLGEDLPEEVSMQMHSRAPWLQPTGVSEVEVDGKTVGRLELSSDYEEMTIDFDPTTMRLLTAKTLVVDGPFVQEGTELIYAYTFTTEALDGQDADATAIDLAGRQRVDSLASLSKPMGRPPAAAGGGRPANAKVVQGKPAPELVLPAFDGPEINLAKLRERVVVIDFWATWCGPCRQALPEMASLARWAKEKAIPIDVIAVNTSEQSRTLQTRRERIAEFIKARGNQLDGLRMALDLNGKVAKDWGISGLPTTVVIDADGRVVSVRSGFRPGEGERLKEELLDLFEGAPNKKPRPQDGPVF